MRTTYDDLPPELVDDIFQYGCILSTSFCVALSQTSSWTRKLALPYLYSTIIDEDKRNIRLLWQNVVARPTDSLIPGFLPRNHVQSICIKSFSRQFIDIFRSCDHLFRLALSESVFHSIVLFSCIQPPPLDKFLSKEAILCKPNIHLLIFSTDNRAWSYQPLASRSRVSPVFNKITHLRFGQTGAYPKNQYLAHLKRLTHVAIPYHRPQVQHLSDLLLIFDYLSTVSLVVVLLTDKLSEEERLDALRWITDVRKSNHRVSAVLSKLEDLQMEWEEEARHGLSIWDKADLFTQSLSS